jgi:predicted nucleic acid-binding protein
MARFVIEPVVAVKWFVPERDSSEAARLLTGAHELLGTGQLIPEAAQIVAAKVRIGELDLGEAREVFEALVNVPISICPTENLMGAALEIAAELDCPYADAVNLALAVQSDGRLVIAQEGLYNAVRLTPFGAYVKWVGDVK